MLQHVTAMSKKSDCSRYFTNNMKNMKNNEANNFQAKNSKYCKYCSK